MSRTASASVFFFIIAGATALTVSACSSGDIAVGSSQQTQALKKKKDGAPTGNGSTCSWDDTVSSDGTSTTPSANGAYKVGDTFKSLDACNNCTCTAQGISCTLLDCGPPAGGCSEEAKQCPDGTYVGRTGPSCAFAPCGTKACTEEAKQCPDGSSVGRSGPNCAFAPCPTGVACTTEAKQCPNGSYVGRTGPSCAFAPCP